ncbi:MULTISPECIES: hypothetical protein [Bacillaceae]|jgi:hypothetical protein|uniref:Abortive phage infection protein n=1 Tax=Gottfriedia luciferensis TaxID=178774 RepID=A0ABX2ZKF5_9BACI|nr:MULTISPECIES: hypothetical protein [Bacillaceae]ODG89726.1 hypothetical protein BED47_15030 [Gottfriedia luciferensis]PGZ86299.1 hypothetical protein COE53_22370 [Bacillus sp. AFS029533]SFC72218.1 hypothetical protein SAMN02799633_01454 [Bacillus sp. UNCCL81]
MEQNEFINLIDQLVKGEISEISVTKDDFLAFRQIIVNRDDFKHFRGIAQHGGHVIYTYLEEARS